MKVQLLQFPAGITEAVLTVDPLGPKMRTSVLVKPSQIWTVSFWFLFTIWTLSWFCRRICPGWGGSWRSRRRWRFTLTQTRSCRRRSTNTRWGEMKHRETGVEEKRNAVFSLIQIKIWNVWHAYRCWKVSTRHTFQICICKIDELWYFSSQFHKLWFL